MTEKVKVVYIISNINKAVAFEWIVEDLSDRIEFEFIILNKEKETDLNRFLIERNIKVVFHQLKGKFHLIVIWLKLLYYFINRRPQIIHTHLFEASLIGLSAAKLAGVKKRIYTRHHSTFHWEYYPKAVKYDRIINFCATNIIAISENVRKVLNEKENVSDSKVALVHHGFRLEKFRNVDKFEKEKLISKYNIPKSKKVIGVVSRFIKLKGIEYIIEAFRKLNADGNYFLVLANANGSDKAIIQKKLQTLNKSDYLEIEFENNLFALYHLFDFYIHVPINNKVEAFGQTYIESLAAGIPSIFTISGVANEFIVDRQNALVVPYKNSEQIVKSIQLLETDELLRSKIIVQGFEDVKQFTLNKMIEKLYKIYTH